MKRKTLLRRPPRKGSLREYFEGLAVGDIREFPRGEVNESSLRTRAGELNTAAGFPKFSIGIDRFQNTIRIMRNG